MNAGSVATEATTRVVLIDDHQCFLDAIRLVLETSAPDMEVVGTVVDPTMAIQLVKDTRPDLVLLDMHFPQEDGLKVLTCLKQLDDCPKVVILSSSSEVEDVRGALFAGASGYLTKDGAAEGVVAAVRAVSANIHVASRSAFDALRIQPAALQLPLSARQVGVLELLGRGKTDAEMAADLFISKATLQRELQQCIRELGARNRTHAAVLAAQYGWI